MILLAVIRQVGALHDIQVNASKTVVMALNRPDDDMQFGYTPVDIHAIATSTSTRILAA